MMINLKDNSEKDKYILELFQTSPKEAFRLLFDAYHMKLCIYAVQLTDSFEMAEDIVQDFFIYFWEKKYYLKINQNLRYYLYLSVRNAAINALQKNNMLSMEELSGIDMGIPEESIDEEVQPAIQQARNLIRNLQRAETGLPLQPFIYQNKGSMATIGRNHAVVELKKLRFGGFPAWAVWLFIHLMSIVGVKNRLFIFVDWMWSYFTYDPSLRIIIKPLKRE